MKNSRTTRRLKRMRVQGYCNISDKELAQLSFGNRFAFILCAFFLIAGIITVNIPVLIGLLIIVFLGIILPNHPFDYIYNYLQADLLAKPRLPKRSKQIKFACALASVLLFMTIYSFIHNYMLAGFIIGSALLSSALLVSSTDICIPSLLYNFITETKI